MNLAITLEHRFSRTPDGSVWTQTQYAYSFWLPYLKVFSGVHVIARIQECSSVPENWLRADGPGVSFIVVPYYIGPWQFWLKRKQVNQAIQSAVEGAETFIARLPSNIGSCLLNNLHIKKQAYAVEVVGDPYDAFSKNSIKHPLRPFFRWWFTYQLKKHCNKACAALYVTTEVLQKRYPCPAYSVGVSDVDLPPEAFIHNPRSWHGTEKPIHLIFVGSLAQLYKAPDVLIEAVSACIEKGLRIKLSIVGDGRYREALEKLAVEKGVGSQIHFLGQLSAGDAVRSRLDQADLFVLPSITEGLPRALVEAMARGLPCIGSSVGGIPELLKPSDLFPPGNVTALAQKICDVVTAPERMTQMSARNLEKAKEFKSEVLQEKRMEFYCYVRDQSKSRLNHYQEIGRSI